MALSRYFLQKYISILKYLFHDQNQVYMQNLSQISGPVCPQLFDLASFLWTIAFDKVEPTLEQGYFIKSLSSGKIVRYIHHREIVIEICEFNLKKGKIMKIV